MPDQTPRDQLAAILTKHVPYVNRRGGVECTCPAPHWISESGAANGWAEHLADRVVAAGWRPPARVITDPTELDALPGRAVVITPAGYLWRHERPGARYPWRLDGHLDGTAANVLRLQSVTVLHTPENGDTE